MDDIDAMFSDLLGEMDLLTQSLGESEAAPSSGTEAEREVDLCVGSTDLNASLSELEDDDLDALMADLVADLNATEEKLAAEIEGLKAPLPPGAHLSSSGPSPAADSSSAFPSPPPQTSKPSMEEIEAQIKAEKIKLALEKLKEAKVKKLVVKVRMNDGSSKTLMVDERQKVRDVLGNLCEKTHCDCNVDQSLCETNAQLQLGQNNTPHTPANATRERTFEDHENLVEPLLAWTRNSENQILFRESPDKYEVFKNPQTFYLWKKNKKALNAMKDKDKEILIQENFCGASVMVPDLEGVLHLKEDGKKSWKPRLFQLRASGIYYVPKGKTKSSRDLVCFVQFDNVNVYYGKDFRAKHKAPNDFCFVLKHPQIQMDSQYIKYLCCDDAWTMNLWVTGIRIAKTNHRARWPTDTPPKLKLLLRTTKCHLHLLHLPYQAAPPPHRQHLTAASLALLPPPLPSKSFPKPVPQARRLPTNFPPPHAAMGDLPPPPPPPTIDDSPPDFLPPPPPASNFGLLPPPPPPVKTLPPALPHVKTLPPPPPSFKTSDLPPPPPDPGFLSPPPPPPPAAAAPLRASVRLSGSVKKMPPPPPKRTTPLHGGDGGGDFMSELMRAMQKKRDPQ
ncbi:amyloid beta A4 precursor protein-binding family B member 1-interacting protein isoform X2 [Phyllopteryx taeniolatus]|uniref:amyloid beta A4 precursor protein-binding family B member 1-interacting protein isoform X2 n=1 Tax=Phyllopteryx taeniolatus TaxID=161469 RepID=UPI002AD57834|nr:amyloid beta A4 precursor protein-binding family B member 1-interacting protein isoform X2 [Phyllopteryx taeniolatus]